MQNGPHTDAEVGWAAPGQTNCMCAIKRSGHTKSETIPTRYTLKSYEEKTVLRDCLSQKPKQFTFHILLHLTP